MNDLDLEQYCEHYAFTNEQLEDYCGFEKRLMNIHLLHARENGDKRDKNLIYIDWIKTFSSQFRMMWVVLKENLK